MGRRKDGETEAEEGETERARESLRRDRDRKREMGGERDQGETEVGARRRLKGSPLFRPEGRDRSEEQTPVTNIDLVCRLLLAGLWGCIPAERRGVASVPASRETLKEGKMRTKYPEGPWRASHTPAACSFPGENARSWVQAWAQSTCPELSAQGLVPLRWGCALPSPNAPGKAPNHIHILLTLAAGPLLKS